ncbi:hypothetical protein GY31_09275 [Lysinibacillus sphaericus]|uniref:hypothetical protein n=1 Tax=Lysinibacillus TaxID=400634 RepID=UPI00084B193A|nr:hypothetical protein [Lysinibacillus sphaericus]OEC02128.1 hypothetical protein GY31_09275 [Lysinibacillus sphaericus]
MKYRKKPVIVEAIQWKGDNWNEIDEWGCACAQTQDDEIWIPTSEGIIKASVGDYVIKGVQGEFYSCKQSVFVANYEEADKPSLLVKMEPSEIDEVIEKISRKLEETLKEVTQ